MASYYVYSGAAGAANGSSWADAYTTLTAALSAGTHYDVFYVAHDHAEATAANVTLICPGFFNYVLCVDRSGSVPPVAADLTTGAVIKSTGDNNVSWIANRSHAHGLTLFAGDGATGFSEVILDGSNGSFESCHFRLGSSGASFKIRPAPKMTWNNCTVQFGATSHFVQAAAGFIWKNTPNAVSGAVIPTTMIILPSGGSFLAEGVDFSAIPSGKTVTGSAGNLGGMSVLKDCKFASGVTVYVPQDGWPFTGIDVVRCDSVGTNYRSERYMGFAAQVTETTIVRTGGASDGVTPISWRIATLTGPTFVHPFESMPISIWNDDTGGAKTVTVEGIWGGGSPPDNDDIWIGVEYLGDSGSPRGSFVSSAKATVLSTAAAYASSSETWGGSTTAFKMAVTTGTIQQKGPITVRVFAALPSSTFYVCPKVAVT